MEIQKVTIRCKGKNLDILHLYNPNCNITEEEFSFYFNQLHADKVVVGDFNGHHPLWTTRCRPNKTGTNLVAALVVDPSISLITPLNLPTYVDDRTLAASTLDLCFTSSMFKVHSSVKILDDCGSDHGVLLVRIGIRPDLSLQKTRPRYKFEESGWPKYHKHLPPVAKDDALQENYDSFTRGITTAADKAFKKTKEIVNPKYHKSWWTPECAEAVQDKKTAKNNFKKHPTLEYLLTKRRTEAIVKKTSKKGVKQSWHGFCGQITSFTGASAAWKKVERLTKGRRRGNNPLIVNGNIITDSNAKANVLASQFEKTLNSSVHGGDLSGLVSLALALSADEVCEYNIPFTNDELTHVLNNLKNSSAGKDCIHNSLLKHLPEPYCEWFLQIINSSWEEGLVPHQWREAVVVPVEKPGKPATSPDSFRPISLLSCSAKVMERMVRNRLEHHLETGKYLSATQAGFRKRSCAIDQVVRLEQCVRRSLLGKGVCMAVYFDLSSAYDRVWHTGLLTKLAKCKVQGKMLIWLKNYLTSRVLSVYKDGEYSSKRNISSGLPQGSTISPILFNVMVSDIPKLEGVHYSEYADDMAIFVSGVNLRELTVKLQNAINAFERWTKSWGLSINITKTKAQLFTRRRSDHPTLNLNSSAIEFVENFRFLGMMMDAPTLNWKSPINGLKTNSINKLNIMHAVSGTYWGADRVMLHRLYTMLVRSRLDYGCVLYSSACEGTLSKLNTIQNSALRVITGARKTSPILSLQVEAHVMPLSLHRKLKLCTYYSRVAELPADSPLVSGNFATIKDDLHRKWSQRNVPPSLVNALTALQSLDAQPVAALHCELVSPFTPWYTIDNIETYFADIAVRDLSPGQVQRLFNCMISTKYGGFLEIYTDGSKLDELNTPSSTAAALVVPQKHTGQGWLLDSRTSVMGAELYGIWRALNWVIDNSQMVSCY